MNNIPNFVGPFKEILPNYIEYKRALGYDYNYHMMYHLKRMDDFFHTKGFTDVKITEEMLELWLYDNINNSKSNQARRNSTIKCLSKYLIEKGYKDIYISDRKFDYSTNFIPYIFSDNEMKLMIKNIDLMKTSLSLRNIETFKMMFLLFYCCGLRLSEAINIKNDDIGFSKNTLKIMDSKNHTSRLLVLTDELNELLLQYSNDFSKTNLNNLFFVKENGNQLYQTDIRRYFWRLLKLSNISKRVNCNGPRIHDLRHTFAVKSLEQMVTKGYDLYTSLPILSKYLGHKSITETEYYLRLTDINYKNINDLNKKYCDNIFPKVGDNK